MSDEYPSPSILDVRRLMGANRFGPHVGAVLEVRTATEARIAAWRDAVQALAARLGWPAVSTEVRPADGGGAHLFLSAPVDQLMTATAVGELAWVRAAGDAAEADGAEAALLAQAAAERQPGFAALRAAAIARGLCTAFDDDVLLLGGGAGVLELSRVAVQADLPALAIARNVPVALVTGSNGKTTTTRLVAAMLRAAGQLPGLCGTDGVTIGNDVVVTGDYSGPDGARRVLRDPRVQAAVLETARGGLLRRGLALTRADAAIVTNVQADHFGEYGIGTLEALAEVKLVVAHAVRPGGRLVLNAADPMLRAHAGEAALHATARIAWFHADADHADAGATALLHEVQAAGGVTAVVRDETLVLRDGAREWPLLPVVEMPIALGGAARHNVANALGAVLLADAMGVPREAIVTALRAFGRSPAENRGRLELHERRGATIVVDYAHNPEGIAALCSAARALPARRRALVLGQAGNRDDAALRALARTAWEALPLDKVILKRMAMHTRGRPDGEVEAILADELRRLGAADGIVEVAESELAAVQRAVAWAEPGDVVLLTVHADRAGVLRWLEADAESVTS